MPMNNDLKFATEEKLKKQSKLLYFMGIQKLWDRYKLCTDKGGNHAETKRDYL